jgi:hypothetical protein
VVAYTPDIWTVELEGAESEVSLGKKSVRPYFKEQAMPGGVCNPSYQGGGESQSEATLGKSPRPYLRNN